MIQVCVILKINRQNHLIINFHHKKATINFHFQKILQYLQQIVSKTE